MASAGTTDALIGALIASADGDALEVAVEPLLPADP